MSIFYFDAPFKKITPSLRLELRNPTTTSLADVEPFNKKMKSYKSYFDSKGKGALIFISHDKVQWKISNNKWKIVRVRGCSKRSKS